MSPPAEFVRVVPEGKLVFGLQLPVAAQSRLFVQPWEAGAGPVEIRRVAEACDRGGFFYIAVCDHIAVPRERAETMSTTWYDAVATLGFLAATTRRVRLLSYVLVAGYRHPLATAKAFATLDTLSTGRVILGVGAGHLEGEFAALGLPFAGRGRVLDEAIDAIRAAWIVEYPDHQGARWKFGDVAVAPRPVQQPRPPIWVGGSTPAALRRAAERGDGWLPQGTPRDQLPAQIETLLAHRARVRGDEVAIDIGANSEWLYVGTPRFDAGPNLRSGSGEEIAASLRKLGDLGVNHVGVRFRTRTCDELVDQIEAFASEVAPHLNE